jgi:hypothetical protein
MDHEDCLLGKLFGRVNWHLLQEPLIDEQLLVSSFLVVKFWNCESSAFKLLRLVIDSDVPLSPFLHLEKVVDHLDDRLHLFIWVLLDLVQKGSHGSAVVSDGVWDTIDDAEL